MNKEKIKVFTAFSGYDSQCLALNRLKDYDKNFDYELVGWSEIDKHAILAHDALFPEAKGLNYGDISKVDWKMFRILICLLIHLLALTSVRLVFKQVARKVPEPVRLFYGNVNELLKKRDRNIFCLKMSLHY